MEESRRTPYADPDAEAMYRRARTLAVLHNLVSRANGQGADLYIVSSTYLNGDARILVQTRDGDRFHIDATPTG